MNDGQEILTADQMKTGLVPAVADLSNEIDEINRQANVETNRYMKYGTVPTFYVPKRSWMRPNKYESTSIKERLSTASTPEEVKSILDIGRAYKSASQGTIRRWERLAEQKLRELSV